MTHPVLGLFGQLARADASSHARCRELRAHFLATYWQLPLWVAGVIDDESDIGPGVSLDFNWLTPNGITTLAMYLDPHDAERVLGKDKYVPMTFARLMPMAEYRRADFLVTDADRTIRVLNRTLMALRDAHVRGRPRWEGPVSEVGYHSLALSVWASLARAYCLKNKGVRSLRAVVIAESSEKFTLTVVLASNDLRRHTVGLRQLPHNLNSPDWSVSVIDAAQGQSLLRTALLYDSANVGGGWWTRFKRRFAENPTIPLVARLADGTGLTPL